MYDDPHLYRLQPPQFYCIPPPPPPPPQFYCIPPPPQFHCVLSTTTTTTAAATILLFSLHHHHRHRHNSIVFLSTTTTTTTATIPFIQDLLIPVLTSVGRWAPDVIKRRDLVCSIISRFSTLTSAGQYEEKSRLG